MTYRQGDNWLVSDRSGKKILASESRREWDGSIVHKSEYFGRQPQDFIKVPRDEQRVALSRPRGIDVFGGPLMTDITATAAAGANSIAVTSSVRFTIADRIGILLTRGDLFRTVVTGVSDATHIEFSPLLPAPVESGAVVTDFDAVTAADLG